MPASRTTIIDRLRREIRGSFQVVARPDHPMLLSGPDLLIGGEGKLTAVIKVGKRDSASVIAARTMAIRLAMPSNTRLYACIADGAKLSDQIAWNFDEIADALETGWTNLVRYAVSDASPRTNKAALIEIKQQHSEKFALAMLFTKLRRQHVAEHVSTEGVIRKLLGANPSKPESSGRHRPMAHLQGAYVTALTSRPKPVDQLRLICNIGLVESYQLDNGVPYPRADSALNVLLVENWPMARHDPEKPVRSAAFGCWITTTTSGADDVAELVSRASDPKYLRRWRRA